MRIEQMEDRITPVVPTVTGVSPVLGSAGGGTLVTITGTDLGAATEVDFGAGNPVEAFAFLSQSPTQIQLDTPAPLTTGVIVDVQVVTPDGTTAINRPADQFTYEGVPTLTSLSQSFGSAGGGDQITITGTSFDGASEVDFTDAQGDVNPVFAPFVSDTATQIVLDTPFPSVSPIPGSPITTDVTVTTPAGVSDIVSADEFTYTTTPTITGLSPSAGAPYGGTSVTIHGANLSDATSVSFGGVPLQQFDFYADDLGDIIATSPPGTLGTSVNVQVTTPEGVAASPDEFMYADVPTVYGLTPLAGPVGGGTPITINGTFFTGATAVMFGGTSVPFHVVNDDEITITSPPGARRHGRDHGDDAERHVGSDERDIHLRGTADHHEHHHERRPGQRHDRRRRFRANLRHEPDRRHGGPFRPGRRRRGRCHSSVRHRG